MACEKDQLIIDSDFNLLDCSYWANLLPQLLIPVFYKQLTGSLLYILYLQSLQLYQSISYFSQR